MITCIESLWWAEKWGHWVPPDLQLGGTLVPRSTPSYTNLLQSIISSESGTTSTCIWNPLRGPSPPVSMTGLFCCWPLQPGDWADAKTTSSDRIEIIFLWERRSPKFILQTRIVLSDTHCCCKDKRIRRQQANRVNSSGFQILVKYWYFVLQPGKAGLDKLQNQLKRRCAKQEKET